MIKSRLTIDAETAKETSIDAFLVKPIQAHEWGVIIQCVLGCFPK
jgi:hypothetical protein